MMRHALPILRRGRFLTADWNDEMKVKDVTWINAAGTEMQDGHWADRTMHCFGMLLDGRAQETGIKRPGSDVTLLICLNAHSDVVNFTLPPFAGRTAGCASWTRVIPTGRTSARSRRASGHEPVVLMFADLIAGDPRRALRRMALEMTRGDALA
jgi:glycogen operon protein